MTKSILDIQIPTGQFGDAGSATSLAMEALALEGERLRRETGEKVGPIMYVFRLPGHTVEQRTTVGTRSSCLEIIEGLLGTHLAKFKMTVDDLFSPACPIKFACVYEARSGNLVTEGNWGEMKPGLAKMLGVFTSSLLGDEVGDLEIVS